MDPNQTFINQARAAGYDDQTIARYLQVKGYTTAPTTPPTTPTATVPADTANFANNMNQPNPTNPLEGIGQTIGNYPTSFEKLVGEIANLPKVLYPFTPLAAMQSLHDTETGGGYNATEEQKKVIGETLKGLQQGGTDILSDPLKAIRTDPAGATVLVLPPILKAAGIVGKAGEVAEAGEAGAAGEAAKGAEVGGEAGKVAPLTEEAITSGLKNPTPIGQTAEGLQIQKAFKLSPAESASLRAPANSEALAKMGLAGKPVGQMAALADSVVRIWTGLVNEVVGTKGATANLGDVVGKVKDAMAASGLPDSGRAALTRINQIVKELTPEQPVETGKMVPTEFTSEPTTAVSEPTAETAVKYVRNAEGDFVEQKLPNPEPGEYSAGNESGLGPEYSTSAQLKNLQLSVTNPVDTATALKIQKALESEAARYYKTDPATYGIFSKASDVVEEATNKGLQNVPVPAVLKSPNVLNTIEQNFGTYGRQLAENAKTFGDLRSFQAPFVFVLKGMRDMMNKGLPLEAAGSPLKAIAAGVGSHLAGPLGAMGLEKVADMIESGNPSLAGAAGNAGNIVSKTMGALGTAKNVLPPIGVAGEVAGQPTPTPTLTPEVVGGTIATNPDVGPDFHIPQTINDFKTDANGNYPFPSFQSLSALPGKQIMTTAQYNDALAKNLQDQTNNQYNPPALFALQNQQKILETQRAASAPLETSYNTSNNINQVAQEAASIMKSVPPGLINKVGWIDEIRKDFNSPYAKLVTDLDYLQTVVKNNILPGLSDESLPQSGQTKEIALQKLDQIQRYNQLQFYNQLNIYGTSGNLPPIQPTQGGLPPSGTINLHKTLPAIAPQ